MWSRNIFFRWYFSNEYTRGKLHPIYGLIVSWFSQTSLWFLEGSGRWQCLHTGAGRCCVPDGSVLDIISSWLMWDLPQANQQGRKESWLILAPFLRQEVDNGYSAEALLIAVQGLSDLGWCWFMSLMEKPIASSDPATRGFLNALSVGYMENIRGFSTKTRNKVYLKYRLKWNLSGGLAWRAFIFVNDFFFFFLIHDAHLTEQLVQWTVPDSNPW